MSFEKLKGHLVEKVQHIFKAQILELQNEGISRLGFIICQTVALRRILSSGILLHEEDRRLKAGDWCGEVASNS